MKDAKKSPFRSLIPILKTAGGDFCCTVGFHGQLRRRISVWKRSRVSPRIRRQKGEKQGKSMGQIKKRQRKREQTLHCWGNSYCELIKRYFSALRLAAAKIRNPHRKKVGAIARRHWHFLAAPSEKKSPSMCRTFINPGVPGESMFTLSAGSMTALKPPVGSRETGRDRPSIQGRWNFWSPFWVEQVYEKTAEIIPPLPAE